MGAIDNTGNPAKFEKKHQVLHSRMLYFKLKNFYEKESNCLINGIVFATFLFFYFSVANFSVS